MTSSHGSEEDTSTGTRWLSRSSVDVTSPVHIADLAGGSEPRLRSSDN